MLYAGTIRVPVFYGAVQYPNALVDLGGAARMFTTFGCVIVRVLGMQATGEGNSSPTVSRQAETAATSFSARCLFADSERHQKKHYLMRESHICL